MPIPVNASANRDDDDNEKSAAKDDGAVTGKGPQNVRRPLADYNVTASTAARSPFTANNTSTAANSFLSKSRQHPNLPKSTNTIPANPTMQAIRLQKKYPEVSQEEMFDLINRFKYVARDRYFGYCEH